jgi:hypothetical protein
VHSIAGTPQQLQELAIIPADEAPSDAGTNGVNYLARATAIHCQEWLAILNSQMVELLW